MPCFHKFNRDLQLDNLGFDPTTLIVGTFNPEWPNNNYAEWFYGRTANNNFWDVLPRIYAQQSLINGNHLQWKEFCQDRLIAITDLISCIEDARIDLEQHNIWLENYSDTNIARNFHEHNWVNIIQLLIDNPTITNVYLTRSRDGFWGNIWNTVRNYCQQNGIECKELLTPSSNARFQLGKYNRQNPNNQLNLSDFILMRWQQQWHQL